MPLLAGLGMSWWMYGAGQRLLAIAAPLCTACVLSGLLEASTDQVDNAILPFHFATVVLALGVT